MKRPFVERATGASGTEGYAKQAGALIPRFESVSFLVHHRAEMHLLPAVPSRILDVGAGTGVDAAWFAAQGHSIVAVEPTAEFRNVAKDLHPSPDIEWVDDALPEIEVISSRGQLFDVIMLSAVWMHLDEAERRVGMRSVCRLLAPKGVLVLSLRHGPVPEGRRMFQVSAEETVALAQQHGMHAVLAVKTESVQASNRAAGVTWSRLAFRHVT